MKKQTKIIKTREGILDWLIDYKKKEGYELAGRKATRYERKDSFSDWYIGEPIWKRN